MPIELPSKYYLKHANELFDYVEVRCSHLLTEQYQDYLNRFRELSEDAQCLWVRLLARKPMYIKLASLGYEEISDLVSAQSELRHHGFVAKPDKSDWSNLAPLMTKPELMEVLRAAGAPFKASSKKELLVSCALEQLDISCLDLANLGARYLAKRRQEQTDYLFFLFFGDLKHRFQQFAMRDLGVLKVRKSVATPMARYDNLAAAQSAFKLHNLRRDFKCQPEQVFPLAKEFVLNAPQLDASTLQLRDKFLLELGDHIVETDSGGAIELWKQSADANAIERWVRLSYKLYGKQHSEAELNQLHRRDDLPSASQVFIEDFYARKFQGKRTSIYTDMVRQTDRKLAIDEAFINDVEEGVILQYSGQQETQAWFTENKLWRVLFAFTFWPLLFRTQHSEFDRLPSPLRGNAFYLNNKNEVEACLETLRNPRQTLMRFTKLATEHYGYPTGLFRWRPDIMDTISACLNAVDADSLIAALRRMAKNYHHAKDGYPDIMVLENGKLRFEEVKAPGDVLRPNQLVSIQRLRESGFTVDITQVEWATNPKQVYAVVDIETTGGRRGGNAITEIAVVKVQGGEIINEWSTLVNPQRAIPRHITQLTGIDNTMVAKAPLFADIADELKHQLENCIFVAHNVGFDYGFIKAGYEAIGQNFRMPKYCTVVHSRKTFPGMKSYSLGNLTQAFDIDLKNHHRALADAKATAHLLRLIQVEKNQKDSGERASQMRANA